jgi:hypothetical protein
MQKSYFKTRKPKHKLKPNQRYMIIIWRDRAPGDKAGLTPVQENQT